MARKIEAFPDAFERSDKYPWSDWGDGDVWELVKGEDFQTAVGSMRQTVAKAAKKRGMAARTRGYKRDGQEILCIQFVKPKTATRRTRA